MGGLSTLGRSSLGGSIRALANQQRAIRAGEKAEAIRAHKQKQADTMFSLEKTKLEQGNAKREMENKVMKEKVARLEAPYNIDETIDQLFSHPGLRKEAKETVRANLGDSDAHVMSGYQMQSLPSLARLSTKEGQEAMKLKKQNAWGTAAVDLEWLQRKMKVGTIPKDSTDFARANELKELWGIGKPEEAQLALENARRTLTSLGVKAGKIIKGTAYNDKDGVRRVPFFQDGKLVREEILEGGTPTKESKDNENFSPQDIGNLQNLSPSELYMEHGFRVNDNGSLYLNPTTGQPTVLPRADKVLGKRGNMKAIMTLGEAWDDAKELTALLDLPEVKADLQSAKEAGLWDRVKGTFKNRATLWMQENGIASDSKTAEAISRVQYMASEKRKSYMGTAVTETEMKSATAWMPRAGDSFETMKTKTNLMAYEAEETFTRWLDVFKNNAQMGPYYDAFGIDRFGGKPTEDDWNVTVDADGNFKVGTGQGG